MKIPQVICYGINWDEHKYPKMKTKDKHQTNGSYKIKQIIIKTMEIHIFIYTYKKKQQSNKIKYSRLNKNQRKYKNYIYQLRT